MAGPGGAPSGPEISVNPRCSISWSKDGGVTFGMNAVILHGAVIGEEALVAALSVVPENMIVPARTLVAGAPAKVRKDCLSCLCAG